MPGLPPRTLRRRCKGRLHRWLNPRLFESLRLQPKPGRPFHRWPRRPKRRCALPSRAKLCRPARPRRAWTRRWQAPLRRQRQRRLSLTHNKPMGRPTCRRSGGVGFRRPFWPWRWVRRSLPWSAYGHRCRPRRCNLPPSWRVTRAPRTSSVCSSPLHPQPARLLQPRLNRLNRLLRSSGRTPQASRPPRLPAPFPLPPLPCCRRLLQGRWQIGRAHG